MPFVQRDENGNIIGVSDQRSELCSESVEPDSIELSDYLSQLRGEAAGIGATDPGFIRVVEDVIELLIDKQIILFTELPVPAQRKMLTRKRLRDELSGSVGDLLSSD